MNSDNDSPGLFDGIGDFGERIVDIVLAIASLLTGSDSAPGWVSLALLAVLAVLCALYRLDARQFRDSIGEARKILSAGEGTGFTRDRLIGIDREFRRLGERSAPRRHLARAWREFRETTVTPESEDARLRNTARPDAFFSREELGQDHGYWRQTPALFVSVGLLLTFLGLVAALEQTSQILDDASGDSNVTEGLKTLLRIAGAKFIMSLTGLLCSILFILFLRRNASRVDRDLRALCEVIERGCDYLSEQSILRDMLEQAREQTTHLQSFSTELVAQIARPLKEDIPQAVREAMEPVVRGISRRAGEDLEIVAARVSSQMTAGVQDSVNAMNETLGAVSGALESVVDRLDKSSNAMSGRIDEAAGALAGQMKALDGKMTAWSETAVENFNRGADTLLERMTQALDDIRAGAAEETRRMEGASRALADAAENLSRSVQETVTAAAKAGGREIVSAGAALAESIGAAMKEIDRNLLGPMTALADRLREIGDRMEAASAQTGKYASAIESGAGAVAAANADLGQTVKTLAEAAAPVRSAVDSIDKATETMADRVETVSRAMLATTEQTRVILGGAVKSVEASQTVVKESLESLQRAVEEFRSVLERYREIDRSLGGAFEQIEGAVRSNIAEFEKFNTELNRAFGDALGRLETVIAQTEPFRPRSTE